MTWHRLDIPSASLGSKNLLSRPAEVPRRRGFCGCGPPIRFLSRSRNNFSECRLGKQVRGELRGIDHIIGHSCGMESADVHLSRWPYLEGDSSKLEYITFLLFFVNPV